MQLIKPSILLADDHGMIRRGISLLIKTEIADYTIAEADSCAAIMSELNKRFYSHLIVDIIFGDGNVLEILPNIKKLYPSLRILVFSMQPMNIHEEAFRQLHISHFLSKNEDDATVVQELENFLHNRKSAEQMAKPIPDHNPFAKLSSRELQILHYMLNGYGTKQISDTLNVKMNSVSTFKKRVYEKTGCDNFKSLIDLCTLYKLNY